MRIVAAALLLAAPAALAQVAPLTLPRPSPKGRVEQQVGLTDISVSYSRPAVNGRKIWGGIVPFGQVWRAGANENTVLTLSSPATVEGHALAAGSYGLHLIPSADGPWTLIVSNVSTAWGSFGYDQKDDAFRAQVTPQPAPQEERLQYTFDDWTDHSTVLSLRWEKQRVPIRVEVDTPQVVVRSLRAELRGAAQFVPQTWAQAAMYCIDHGVNLDEAARWADKSVSIRPTFQNQLVKARLAEKAGDAGAAAELRKKALGMANETELNQYAYGLLGQGKRDEAIALFRRIVAQHPESWNAHDSLGEALAAAGDKRAAIEQYSTALAMVKDPQQRQRIEGVLAGLKQ